jgi:hypothetical protein
VLQAALAGTLAPDDTVDLIRAILASHEPEAAELIVSQLLDQLPLVFGSRSEVQLLAPDERARTRRARDDVLGLAQDELGVRGLLSFDVAVERLSRSSGRAAAETLEAARSVGAVLALVVDGEFAVPSFQIDPDGYVPEIVQECNIRLNGRTEPWGATAWWLQRDARVGQAPWRLLRRHSPRAPYLAEEDVLRALVDGTLEPAA